MKHIVLHGGVGPTPGTQEARALGCSCPGDVGDPDRWGQLGGHTVDNECPLHGREARRQVEREARESFLRLMADTETYQ